MKYDKSMSAEEKREYVQDALYALHRPFAESNDDDHPYFLGALEALKEWDTDEPDTWEYFLVGHSDIKQFNNWCADMVAHGYIPVYAPTIVPTQTGFDYFQQWGRPKK